MVNPKVPLPMNVIEYGRVYHQFLYEGKDYLKITVDRFDQLYESLDGKDKVYYDFFLASANNLAKDMDKIETKYSRKRKHLDNELTRRTRNINRIKNGELNEVSRISESVSSLFDRGAPTLVAYIAAKSCLPQINLLPEFIAGTTFFVAHFILSKCGRTKRNKINDKYESSTEETESEYEKKCGRLDSCMDREKRKKYSRAEEKLKKDYETYFGIRLEGETSADRFYAIETGMEKTPSEISKDIRKRSRDYLKGKDVTRGMYLK